MPYDKFIYDFSCDLGGIALSKEIVRTEAVRRLYRNGAISVHLPCSLLSLYKEIVQSPQYQCQEIHLHDHNEVTSDSSSTSSSDEDEGSDSEPIAVFLDTITSENSVNSMSSYPNKIYTTVKINDQCSIQMKVEICIILLYPSYFSKNSTRNHITFSFEFSGALTQEDKIIKG